MNIILRKKALHAPIHFSFIIITMLFCTFSIPGCNLVTKGNIIATENDSYKIAKEGENSLEIRQHIWQEADSFCRKNNQYFMPVTKNYDQTSYEMEFRCLNAGDPELLEGETPYQGKRYHKKLGGYGEVEY